MQTSRWICLVALVGAGACTVHEPDSVPPSTGYTQPYAGTGYYADQAAETPDDGTVYAAPVQTDDVVYSEDPTLVAIEPDVYVIQDSDQPVYWVDNSYWRYDYPQSTWYRSPSYVGGWVSVGAAYVPPRIVSRDHQHYMHYHGDHDARTLRAPAPTYAPPPQAQASRPPPLHIGRLPGTLPNHGVAHAPPAVAPAPVARPNVAPPAPVAPRTPPTATGGGPYTAAPPHITMPVTPPHAAPPAAPPHVTQPAAPPHITQPAAPPHVTQPAAPPRVTPPAAPPHAAPPATHVAPHVAPPVQAAPSNPHSGHHSKGRK